MQGSGPVFGEEGRFQPGQVRCCHGHQPAGDHRGGPVGAVEDAVARVQHTGTQVEGLAVVDHLGRVRTHPRALVCSPAQRQPVRQIDQALVFAAVPLHVAAQPVEHPGDVGPGMVHPISGDFRRCAAGDQVAVAQRAESFPSPLCTRVKIGVAQPPRCLGTARGTARFGGGIWVWHGACHHLGPDADAEACVSTCGSTVTRLIAGGGVVR